MPFIQNLSKIDVARGHHLRDPNSYLIQILKDDPFPTPVASFLKVWQFRFADVDDPKYASQWRERMTQEQSDEIARILRDALAQDINVFVHCAAGICRSGAVAEVGTMLGFEDAKAPRIPNVYVKRMLMESLGMVPDYYDMFSAQEWMG